MVRWVMNGSQLQENARRMFVDVITELRNKIVTLTIPISAHRVIMVLIQRVCFVLVTHLIQVGRNRLRMSGLSPKVFSVVSDNLVNK